MADTRKKDSPSAERNKEVIWETLNEHVFPNLGKDINVLEVAAGTGIHAVHFGRRHQKNSLPDGSTRIHWYPTDPSAENRASIQAYMDELLQEQESSLFDVHAPLSLTLDENGVNKDEASQLPTNGIDLIICINMVHISRWSATVGLLREAGRRLTPSKGYLYLYGPYRVKGECSESNRYVRV